MKNKILIISVLVVGIAGILLWGLGIPRYGFALDTFKVGYIDYNKVIESHPRMEKAKKDLSDFAQKTQTDYQKQLDEAVKNKTANEAQQIKAEYESRLNETVNKRWQELLNPIINDVKKAVSDVAKKNGIDVVLRGDIVITGGIDITDDVIKVIKK